MGVLSIVNLVGSLGTSLSAAYEWLEREGTPTLANKSGAE